MPITILGASPPNSRTNTGSINPPAGIASGDISVLLGHIETNPAADLNVVSPGWTAGPAMKHLIGSGGIAALDTEMWSSVAGPSEVPASVTMTGTGGLGAGRMTWMAFHDVLPGSIIMGLVSESAYINGVTHLPTTYTPSTVPAVAAPALDVVFLSSDAGNGDAPPHGPPPGWTTVTTALDNNVGECGMLIRNRASGPFTAPTFTYLSGPRVHHYIAFSIRPAPVEAIRRIQLGHRVMTPARRPAVTHRGGT